MKVISMIVESGDRKTIGNKAFDLYRCGLLGVRVPEFVVLTSDCNIMDPVLHRALGKTLERLGGVVAVRSSSVKEDGYGRSAAGRYKTVLNVRSGADIFQAVEEIRKSADSVDMAVIIQKQLQPEVSGVLFTRNPANGKREMVIEYVAGLGDKLVSGKVRPVKLSNDDEGSKFKRLKTIARKLEASFGYPLDIEWAFCENEFYILQSRPITAIPPPALGTSTTYSRVSAEQFYSGPVSPLFYSFFNHLHSRYYLKETMDDIGWDLSIKSSLVRHKSHLYVDTALAEYALTHFPVKGGKELFKEIFPEDLKAELKNRKSHLDLKNALGLIKFIFRSPGIRPWNLDKHFQEEVVPQIYAALDDLTDFENKSLEELNAAYERTMAAAILHVRFSKWGLALYLPLFLGALDRFVKENGGGNAHLSELMGELPVNKTMDASMELHKLAQLIQEEPEAVLVLQQDLNSYYDYKKRLLSISSGELIIDYFESILKRYGHRRLSRDLLAPSWNDEPDIPFSILKNIVRSGSSTDFEPAKLSKKRKGKLYRQFSTKLSPVKKLRFRILSKYFVRYVTFREYQRFYLDMIISKMRVLMLEVACRMVKDSLLDQPEDIFFVELYDVMDYFNGKRESGLRHKAIFNRITFENEIETPGKFLRGGVDFDSITVQKEHEVKVGGKLHSGQSISPGIFSGRAKVIPFIDSNSSIARGDIIVTRSIDPGQTHIFLLAGALILEVGGMLSHGAILAREFNLPTIANVKNATGIYKNGQRLSVNGSSGEIIILGN